LTKTSKRVNSYTSSWLKLKVPEVKQAESLQQQRRGGDSMQKSTLKGCNKLNNVNVSALRKLGLQSCSKIQCSWFWKNTQNSFLILCPKNG
jgi:hypothetical protein